MLTAQNHIRYCALHNYTYMAVNEPYNMYNNLEEISDLLREYDVVYTCDSDIVITNQAVPITDFAKNYVNAAMEGWGPNMYSIFNGGLLIFYKKDDGIFDYLKKFAEFQEESRSFSEEKYIQVEYKSGRNDIKCLLPAWSLWGTQSALNLAFVLGREDVISGIGAIASGML